MPDNYSIHFSLANIGPFADLKFNKSFDKDEIKLAVYATNGTGKTFISRCFNVHSFSDKFYPLQNLVSFGKEAGSFTLKYLTKENYNTDFSIDINNNTASYTFKKNEKFHIFYVFNSDYVKKNFIERDYNPDSNIEGEIIIGEDNAKYLDIQKDNETLNNNNNTIKTTIEDAINDTKQKLKEGFEVKQNTTEFTNISFNNILSEIEKAKFNSTDLEESFKKLETYSSISEEEKNDIENINKISFVLDINLINSELQKSYTKNDIKEQFLDKIKRNPKFIQTGLELFANGNRCPFCDHPISKFDEIISAYNNFFDDTQRKLQNTLEEKISYLKQIKDSILSTISITIKRIKRCKELKSYFPSTCELSLDVINVPENLLPIIDNCICVIENKIGNISETNFDIQDDLTAIKQSIIDLNNKIEEFNGKINKINKAKNKANNELLDLKRKLCQSYFYDLKQKFKDKIEEYTTNCAKIRANDEEIKRLKSTKTKKDLVYKDFDNYLKCFFADKYEVDQNSFQLKLYENSLDKPSLVLSDGEKNIIAFCYYLANIHSIVDNDEDYNKIFFIIDDPISSLDYNYVYETAQIIKYLKDTSSVKNVRFIIFTHNAEFMNVLCNNKVLSSKGAYYLKKGEKELKELKNAFVAPYQDHLQDIFNISKGKASPNHTTYNSIRHVLECIMSFIDPNINSLDDFVEDQKVNGKKLFDNNGHIKRIIQDMSHGKHYTHTAIDEDKTIQGCKELIDYITEKFPGQIKHLNK